MVPCADCACASLNKTTLNLNTDNAPLRTRNSRPRVGEVGGIDCSERTKMVPCADCACANLNKTTLTLNYLGTSPVGNVGGRWSELKVDIACGKCWWAGELLEGGHRLFVGWAVELVEGGHHLLLMGGRTR